MAVVTRSLAFFVFEETFVDFSQRDRQWLFSLATGDQWAYKFEHTVIWLLAVAINLASPLGSEDDQSIFRGHVPQKLVNGRIGDTRRRIKDLFVVCNILAHGFNEVHLF